MVMVRFSGFYIHFLLKILLQSFIVSCVFQTIKTILAVINRAIILYSFPHSPGI